VRYALEPYASKNLDFNCDPSTIRAMKALLSVVKVLNAMLFRERGVVALW
jgi:hypothetical protein